MSCISGSVWLSGRRAFTLVELLVVVAIIALLVSILLPTLGKAKAIARMVKCMTNLHTIGRAAHMYATENKDYVPRGAKTGEIWMEQGYYRFGAKFSHYLGGPKVPFEYDTDDDYLYKVFKEIPAYQCPSFKDREYVLTYITNGQEFTDPIYYETPAASLSTLPRAAADIPYICELNSGVVLPTDWFGGYDFFWEEQLPFNWRGLPNVVSTRIIRFDDDRHAGQATMLFFDGHTENRRLDSKEMPLKFFFPDSD